MEEAKLERWTNVGYARQLWEPHRQERSFHRFVHVRGMPAHAEGRRCLVFLTLNKNHPFGGIQYVLRDTKAQDTSLCSRKFVAQRGCEKRRCNRRVHRNNVIKLQRNSFLCYNLASEKDDHAPRWRTRTQASSSSWRPRRKCHDFDHRLFEKIGVMQDRNVGSCERVRMTRSCQ